MFVSSEHPGLRLFSVKFPTASEVAVVFAKSSFQLVGPPPSAT